MEVCEIPTEEMLPPPVLHVNIDDPGCGFDCAKDRAVAEARKYGKAPEVLSWFDRKSGRHSQGDECCVDGEPTWLAYAESKGTHLTIDVNHGEYIFLFHQSESMV